MLNEKEDFVEALARYVDDALRHAAGGGDYISGAVQIVDARNHLFREAGNRSTDEEAGIYALRDLCRVDEDTLDTVPNRQRFAAIAREYGLH